MDFTTQQQAQIEIALAIPALSKKVWANARKLMGWITALDTTDQQVINALELRGIDIATYQALQATLATFQEPLEQLQQNETVMAVLNPPQPPEIPVE